MAHLDEVRRVEIVAAASENNPLQARNVTVTQGLLSLISRAISDPNVAWHRVGPSGPVLHYLPAVRFDGAIFADAIDLSRTFFGGPASFAGVHFRDDVSFRQSEFARGASFREAVFTKRSSFAFATFQASLGDLADVGLQGTQSASFERCEFAQLVAFNGVTFKRRSSFVGASFAGDASFRGTSLSTGSSFRDAEFSRGASFVGTQGDGGIRFDRARFGEETRFDGCRFGRNASFAATAFGERSRIENCEFGEDASFGGARFGRRTRLGPCSCPDRLAIDETVFDEGCEVALRAPFISAEGVKVGDGTTITLNGGVASFAGTRFGRATVLRSSPVKVGERFPRPAQADEPHGVVAITSLVSADLHGLAMSYLDLTVCRFVGAHGLDSLRLGPGVRFPETPAGLRAGLMMPPIWIWSHRRVLAEEILWRRSTKRGADWPESALTVTTVTDDFDGVREELVQELKMMRDRFEQKHKLLLTDNALDQIATFARAVHEREELDAALDLLEAACEYRLVREYTGLDRGEKGEEGLLERLEELRRAKEQKILNQEWEAAASYRDQEREVQAQIARTQAQRLERMAGSLGTLPSSVRPEVGDEDVNAVVAAWLVPGLREELDEHSIRQDPEPPVDPASLASIYRAMRKGREDEKDAPGAADFYYGEMEMRRHARPRITSERALLTLYWASSGYALRALRAIGALLLSVAALGLMLHAFGLNQEASLPRAWLFMSESAVPGLSAERVSLTYTGDVLRIIMHLLGPLLLGLTLLSLRGRVQR